MMIQSKLPNVGTTIFTVMSQIAVKNNAINLGQGFPDYPMNTDLQELVFNAMSDGFNQYAPSIGYPPLLEKLALKFDELYQAKIDPLQSITITPGGTYAIYNALTVMLHTGDEVIVFDPAYDCYAPAIELNGAKPVFIPLNSADFSIDWDLVNEKINAKTKLIIINNPHNPTGQILTASDIQQLQNIVQKHDVYIISDEVYEHLIFDGKKHESILKYPDLFERSFVCFSLGKTYNCTGWKIGYIVAPNNLMQEFRKIHQFNCFSTFTPAQVAFAKYLDNRSEYLDLGSAMQKKRDFLLQALDGLPLSPLPSYGSYFQCYGYIGERREKGFELAKHITEEYKVTTIPINAFYNNPTEENAILRFCFCKKEETLLTAAERLASLK